MGKHRSGEVAPQGRGKHRAPTNTGRTLARVAAAGVVLTTPVTIAAGTANASAPAGALSASAPTGVLDEIARCESGGNYRAQNPSSSASGKYQFIDSTWRAYRGSSSAARAKDASPAEQEAAARRLLAAQGTAPWNASKSCWGRPGKSVAPKVVPESDRSKRSAADSETRSKRVAPKPAPKVSKAPAKSVAPKPAPKSESKQSNYVGKHRVQAGDTLSEIALRYNGNGNWTELYRENRDVIGSNPHLIRPGQVLDVKGDK